MTRIDIVSGFLGAGKTTLIKKLLKDALAGSKTVLIENEFGEIGIDGGFLKEAGIEIREMNSGCICCSLVGDFGTSLREVMRIYEPDRILIEPSGVGKLSDVMKAVQGVTDEKEVVLNSAVAVVDALKCKMYMKNFGEFFINQIAHAGTIVLSRTGSISDEKLNTCISLLREHNEKATIITTPWEDLDGKDILSAMEGAKNLEAELLAEIMARHEEEEEHEHHHHHGHEHDHHDHGEHGHGHSHGHHHDDEEGHEHSHEHHHDDEEGHEHSHEHHHDDEHEHEHDHHDHGEHGHGHGHHHDHEEGHDHEHGYHHQEHDEHEHHHHHADEIFTSWGMETPKAYSKEEIEAILEALSDEETYGLVLRAKGMVPGKEGGWIYFDYVPEETNVRDGKPDVTGKFCVIGSFIKEEALEKLFGR